jgi:hypothetical protein
VGQGGKIMDEYEKILLNFYTQYFPDKSQDIPIEEMENLVSLAMAEEIEKLKQEEENEKLKRGSTFPNVQLQSDIRRLELSSRTRTKRSRWSWTKRNRKRADEILIVLEDMEEYWPVSIRTLFYQLIPVSGAHWDWKGKQVDVYKALSRTLKWMRIDNIVQHNSFKDDERTLTIKQGWTDMEDYVNEQLGFSFAQYNRCVAQEQPRYIEVWIEKHTVLDWIKPIADEFCLRIMVGKGYNSITYQAEFYQRAKAAQEQGQIVTVLYFGDWDPSGLNMFSAGMQTIEDELGLEGVEYYRCGVNPKHFARLKRDPVPVKPSDPRAKKFVEEHGTIAYELDAFHPEDLKKLVRDAIVTFTDMEILEAHRKIEGRETKHSDKMDNLLKATKAQVLSLAESRG